MSDRKLYINAAESLRSNPGQLAAYNSTGHCVVIAGPGSGKTKTLTLKLARMLSEDVQEPRGLACITYNNECARELETRLDALGISPSGRVFIGTVHSFSLTQIVMPYANTANLGLPENFGVATRTDSARALEAAYYSVIDGPDNPQNWSFRMNNYRRSILNRNHDSWQRDPQLAALVERYEHNLRKMGLIDFDDMPLLAVRALQNNEWLPKAIHAKYPILVVDEYQDLGRALHRMVMGLCFSAGLRLFAVGDPDQSIYGFTGAQPQLLESLAVRDDVETIHLRLNYRCGSNIVSASNVALGQERGYSAVEEAEEGVIYFHPQMGNHDHHADHVFSQLLPDILERNPHLSLGDIAILYPTAAIGDSLAHSAEQNGHPFLRTDGNALYPRSNKVMRWLEGCAQWCCEGWRTGSPRYSQIVNEGGRIFAEAILNDTAYLSFQRQLLTTLNTMKDGTTKLSGWLKNIKEQLLDGLLKQSRTLQDDSDVLSAFSENISVGGEYENLTLGQFAGFGEGSNCINLSTLHSSKGREFSVVIMFGMDAGTIPWNNPSQQQLLESRRLFYVGFTRAKSELHMVYTASRPSRFVNEIKAQIIP